LKIRKLIKKPKYNLRLEEIRIYSAKESCIFKKNNEAFGELSNMSTLFPILVNDIRIKTVEALYQSMRFPHMPQLQNQIILEKSPMRVKMISNKYKRESRKDWEIVRLQIMKWCLNVKYSQNIFTFHPLLCKTGNSFIVENSSSDNFWGAIPDENGEVYKGKNALGRLLMELREKAYSKYWMDLLYVSPPNIEHGLLLDRPIGIVDERSNFLSIFAEYWKRKGIPLDNTSQSNSPSFDFLNKDLIDLFNID